MFCSKCGNEVEAGAAFCGKCGQKVGQQGPAVKVSSGGSKTALIVLVVAGVFLFVIAIVGILAAIAIPNFLKYQAKAKQSEAKTNLKGLFVVEMEYYGDNGRYSDSFEDLAWAPVTHTTESGPAYCYYLGEYEVYPGECGGMPEQYSTEAWADDESFRAIAIGNIDSDDTPDVWAIDSENNLVNLVDDVRN